MREYLFRGKCCGEWIEGSLIHAGNYVCILQDESKVHPCDFPYLDAECGIIVGKAEPVDPETVGQFIGITDKNGKRIFEGDILQKNGCKYRVYYYPTFAMYMLTRLPKGGGSNGMLTQIFDCEVIGNIYDNPELLETA